MDANLTIDPGREYTRDDMRKLFADLSHSEYNLIRRCIRGIISAESDISRTSLFLTGKFFALTNKIKGLNKSSTPSNRFGAAIGIFCLHCRMREKNEPGMDGQVKGLKQTLQKRSKDFTHLNELEYKSFRLMILFAYMYGSRNWSSQTRY